MINRKLKQEKEIELLKAQINELELFVIIKDERIELLLKDREDLKLKVEEHQRDFQQFEKLWQYGVDIKDYAINMREYGIRLQKLGEYVLKKEGK